MFVVLILHLDDGGTVTTNGHGSVTTRGVVISVVDLSIRVWLSRLAEFEDGFLSGWTRR